MEQLLSLTDLNHALLLLDDSHQAQAPPSDQSLSLDVSTMLELPHVELDLDMATTPTTPTPTPPSADTTTTLTATTTTSMAIDQEFESLFNKPIIILPDVSSLSDDDIPPSHPHLTPITNPNTLIKSPSPPTPLPLPHLSNQPSQQEALDREIDTLLFRDLQHHSPSTTFHHFDFDSTLGDMTKRTYVPIQLHPFHTTATSSSSSNHMLKKGHNHMLKKEHEVEACDFDSVRRDGVDDEGELRVDHLALSTAAARPSPPASAQSQHVTTKNGAQPLKSALKKPQHRTPTPTPIPRPLPLASSLSTSRHSTHDMAVGQVAYDELKCEIDKLKRDKVEAGRKVEALEVQLAQLYNAHHRPSPTTATDLMMTAPNLQTPSNQKHPNENGGGSVQRMQSEMEVLEKRLQYAQWVSVQAEKQRDEAIKKLKVMQQRHRRPREASEEMGSGVDREKIKSELVQSLKRSDVSSESANLVTPVPRGPSHQPRRSNRPATRSVQALEKGRMVSAFPFIPAATTRASRSHHVGANIQNVQALLKSHPSRNCPLCLPIDTDTDSNGCHHAPPSSIHHPDLSLMLSSLQKDHTRLQSEYDHLLQHYKSYANRQCPEREWIGAALRKLLRGMDEKVREMDRVRDVVLRQRYYGGGGVSRDENGSGTGMGSLGKKEQMRVAREMQRTYRI